MSGLSEEQMRMLDSATPWWLRLGLRFRRLGRFAAGTALALVATALLAVLAAVVYFGVPVLTLALTGG